MSEGVAVRHMAHGADHHHPLHAARTPAWTSRATSFGVFTVLALGAVYATTALVTDLSSMPPTTTILPFVLLGVALLIALGFEFVNGFHDTANAVATVIYTHSMSAQVAVVWSGIWNLIGVLSSAGLVAFTIVSLLPVELILQVGSAAGFAMVFALLIAAIIWNIGTWYFGIPNSSSHALIGSIIGVGLMNQLMGGPNGTSGVDWSQATNVFRSLAFSPVVGFALSALLLLIADISRQVMEYGALARVPAERTTNVRNDMYLASEMLARIAKSGEPQFEATEQADLKTYKAAIDNATKFIPTWVKVAVAIALGMGTMIGWKRIVVTVGEQIGKTHLTYGQGAAAAIVAAATIGAADMWGWPVSTTHVLSSGVAGTIAANRSGLQWSTILNMAAAWVLTLPAAITLF